MLDPTLFSGTDAHCIHSCTRHTHCCCCCLSCLNSQPEPNALEKKLLRKRQRQEQSDAIAGEMGSHGVTDSIVGEEGESKTASFKAKKKRERKQPASLPEEDARPDVVAGEGSKKAVQEDCGPASGGGEGEAAKDAGDGEEGPGEKSGRKRKTKRKKRKPAAEEIGGGADDGAEIPQPSAAAAVATAAAAEGKPPAEDAAGEADGENPEEPEQGTKKQRRGWGKARSKTAAPAGGEGVENANAAVEGAAWKRRSRKKTRSKQKNIRKDKRPLGERPAYLRAGDPEFCGRGLTDETRKFLGLPQDGFGSAPPAGWGQPGTTGVSPGRAVHKSADWVVDKKPSLTPQHSVSRDEGNGVEEPDSGVAVDPKRKVSPVVEARPSGKSKYKNLALPPGKKSKADKVSAKQRRRSGEGAGRKQAES